jgi:hypothetical protein
MCLRTFVSESCRKLFTRECTPTHPPLCSSSVGQSAHFPAELSLSQRGHMRTPILFSSSSLCNDCRCGCERLSLVWHVGAWACAAGSVRASQRILIAEHTLLCMHCCYGQTQSTHSRCSLSLLHSSLSNLAVALSSGNEKLLTAERNQAVERMMIVAQKLSLG